MKRTTVFVTPKGMAECRLADGRVIRVPVVQGILKHLAEADLPGMLADPAVARKYTAEALRVAPWPVLRLFAPDWLRECMPRARLRESRARALEFLLTARDG